METTMALIEKILLPLLRLIRRSAGLSNKHLDIDLLDEEGIRQTFKDGPLELHVGFMYETPTSLDGLANHRTEVAVYIDGDVTKNGVVYFKRKTLRSRTWEVNFSVLGRKNCAVGKLAEELGIEADVDIKLGHKEALKLLRRVCARIRQGERAAPIAA